jgi:hypothetical protein
MQQPLHVHQLGFDLSELKPSSELAAYAAIKSSDNLFSTLLISQFAAPIAVSISSGGRGGCVLGVSGAFWQRGRILKETLMHGFIA